MWLPAWPPLSLRRSGAAARGAGQGRQPRLALWTVGAPGQVPPQDGTMRARLQAGHTSLDFRIVALLFMAAPTGCGLPPGGLHPIGTDHRLEQEQSRAWSAGLPRCFGRAEARRT